MRKLLFTLVLALLLVPSVALPASDTITFGWEQDMVVPVVGWRIYQSETAGAYSTTPFQTLVYDGTVKPEYTATTVVTVPAGTMKTFYWVVTAYNGVMESAWSNEVSTSHDFRAPTVPVTFRATVTHTP